MNTKIKELIMLNLNEKEVNEFLFIAVPIITHPEFLRRCTNEFMHHGNTTLGEHIIKDAIITYKKSKEMLKKRRNISVENAVIIALCHDLYCKPWQNNSIKKKRIINRHGFTHPVEAALNSLNWYPEIFNDEEKTKIIIDGILHHMYPFPVRKVDSNDLEINNKELLLNINNLKLLIELTRSSVNLGITVRPSRYIEGRIMSSADKKSSKNEFKNIYSIVALITGKNSKLLKCK